jgi:hypothetical protein
MGQLPSASTNSSPALDKSQKASDKWQNEHNIYSLAVHRGGTRTRSSSKYYYFMHKKKDCSSFSQKPNLERFQCLDNSQE